MVSFRKIPPRGYIAYAHDIVMAALSFLLSLYLRLGDGLVYYPVSMLAERTFVFTVIAAALGRPNRLFAVPDGLLRLAGAMTGKSDMIARLLDSLCIDDGKIRRQLGWTPPHTVEQGLCETARWFLSTADD